MVINSQAGACVDRPDHIFLACLHALGKKKDDILTRLSDLQM